MTPRITVKSKGSPSSPEGQGYQESLSSPEGQGGQGSQHHRQVQKDEDELKKNIKNKLGKNLSDPNVNEEINSTHKNSFLISFHGCGLLFLILMSNWRNL